MLGVERFYLFNNLSQDNYLEILDPYIKAEIVELHDWPYKSIPGNDAAFYRIQYEAYTKGLELAKGKSKWVAIIDTDEILFPLEKENLVEFLQDYATAAAFSQLAMFWVVACRKSS